MKIQHTVVFSLFIDLLLTSHISVAEQEKQIDLKGQALIEYQNKTYAADKITFHDFKINAFENVANHGSDGSGCGKNGSHGSHGKNAGNVTIEAYEASGTLHIDLTGQTGGNGGTGANGCQGAKGDDERPYAKRFCKYDRQPTKEESKHLAEDVKRELKKTSLETFACDGDRGNKHCTLAQLDKFYQVRSKDHDCNHRQETYKCDERVEKGCHETHTREVCTCSPWCCDDEIWLCCDYKTENYSKWNPNGCPKKVHDTCEQTIHDTCTAKYQCTVTRDSSTVRATHGKTGGKGGNGGRGGNGGNGGNITLKFRDKYDLKITLQCAGGSGGNGGREGDGGTGGEGGKGYYYPDGNIGPTGPNGSKSDDGTKGNDGSSVTLKTLTHNLEERKQVQEEIKELEARITEIKKIAKSDIGTTDLNEYPLVNEWLENSNQSYYRHFDMIRHIDLDDPATAAKNYQAKMDQLLDEERITFNQVRQLNEIRQQFMGYLSEEMVNNKSLQRLRKSQKDLQNKQDELNKLLNDWHIKTFSCLSGSSEPLHLKSF